MQPAASARILFVDDDQNLLDALKRTLRKRFSFDTASGGQEALAMLASHGPYAVIVADMSMPVMNGVELLEAVKTDSPDTVRVMLTGNADQRSAVDAVNRGSIFRFLTKPCDPDELAATLDTALKQYELVTTEKALLNQTLNGSIQVLTDILAMFDPEAFGHAQQRRAAVHGVAPRLGVTSSWDLEITALLAEIGRVTLPPQLREKIRAQQPLTPAERHLVERVPEFSSRVLSTIPRMDTVAKAVLYQNKNYDGSGFPADKVRGADIPLGARLFRILDAIVLMLRRGVPVGDALAAVRSGPEHYDPALVRTLASCSSSLCALPASSSPGVRRLSLAELTPGNVLLADITTSDGTVVQTAGVTLSSVLLQRLRNYSSLNRIAEPIAVEIPPAENMENGGARAGETAAPAVVR